MNVNYLWGKSDWGKLDFTRLIYLFIYCEFVFIGVGAQAGLPWGVPSRQCPASLPGRSCGAFSWCCYCCQYPLWGCSSLEETFLLPTSAALFTTASSQDFLLLGGLALPSVSSRSPLTSCSLGFSISFSWGTWAFCFFFFLGFSCTSSHCFRVLLLVCRDANASTARCCFSSFRRFSCFSSLWVIFTAASSWFRLH